MVVWLQTCRVRSANSFPVLSSFFFRLPEKMLMKNYALFVLVGGENIFHGVGGHKASQILCDEERKCEPLKLFKRFPLYLRLRAKPDLFQRTPAQKGLKLHGSNLWVFVEGNMWSEAGGEHEIVVGLLMRSHCATGVSRTHTFSVTWWLDGWSAPTLVLWASTECFLLTKICFWKDLFLYLLIKSSFLGHDPLTPKHQHRYPKEKRSSSLSGKAQLGFSYCGNQSNTRKGK